MENHWGEILNWIKIKVCFNKLSTFIFIESFSSCHYSDTGSSMFSKATYIEWVVDDSEGQV